MVTKIIQELGALNFDFQPVEGEEDMYRILGPGWGIGIGKSEHQEDYFLGIFHAPQLAELIKKNQSSQVALYSQTLTTYLLNGLKKWTKSSMLSTRGNWYFRLWDLVENKINHDSGSVLGVLTDYVTESIDMTNKEDLIVISFKFLDEKEGATYRTQKHSPLYTYSVDNVQTMRMKFQQDSLTYHLVLSQGSCLEDDLLPVHLKYGIHHDYEIIRDVQSESAQEIITWQVENALHRLIPPFDMYFYDTWFNQGGRGTVKNWIGNLKDLRYRPFLLSVIKVDPEDKRKTLEASIFDEWEPTLLRAALNAIGEDYFFDLSPGIFEVAKGLFQSFAWEPEWDNMMIRIMNHPRVNKEFFNPATDGFDYRFNK